MSFLFSFRTLSWHNCLYTHSKSHGRFPRIVLCSVRTGWLLYPSWHGRKSAIVGYQRPQVSAWSICHSSRGRRVRFLLTLRSVHRQQAQVIAMACLPFRILPPSTISQSCGPSKLRSGVWDARHNRNFFSAVLEFWLFYTVRVTHFHNKVSKKTRRVNQSSW